MTPTPGNAADQPAPRRSITGKYDNCATFRCMTIVQHMVIGWRFALIGRINGDRDMSLTQSMQGGATRQSLMTLRADRGIRFFNMVTILTILDIFLKLR
jgi:hypothetical protein